MYFSTINLFHPKQAKAVTYYEYGSIYKSPEKSAQELFHAIVLVLYTQDSFIRMQADHNRLTLRDIQFPDHVNMKISLLKAKEAKDAKESSLAVEFHRRGGDCFNYARIKNDLVKNLVQQGFIFKPAVEKHHESLEAATMNENTALEIEFQTLSLGK